MTINWHDDSGPARSAAGRPRPLTEGEQQAAWTVAVLVAALGLLGFVNSFRAVSQTAVASFGGLAPTVPLGIDLAIAVFSGMDLVLARLGMRPRWVPLVPWSLTSATVYLNVAGQHTWFGRIAHAVFPALWVLAVSLAAHVIRIRAQLAAGTGMDRIRASRWLLAPVSTARLWRRMVLWEIRSYPAALDRERTRLLALTDLQDTYGVIAWRWNAPRRIRALYRLGELTPAGLVRDDPRMGIHPAALPDRTPEPEPAARTDNPARTGSGGDRGAPLAGEPRTAVVEMVAGQIRDAVEAGVVWRPDYEELMQLTDRRRSWCEKVVRDARNLVLTPPGGDNGTAPADQGRTDTGPGGADNSPYAAADRTGDLAMTAAP